MPTSTVRVATLADADAIAAIHIGTWKAAYAGLIPRDYLDGLDEAEFAARWRKWLSDVDASKRYLVAETNGLVVGFVSAGPSREDADTEGEIYAIYVLPQSWGTGAGRALMAAASEFLRMSGFAEVILWVLTANTRTRRFYEIAGMKPDGAVKVDRRGEVELHETRYRMAL